MVAISERVPQTPQKLRERRNKLLDYQARADGHLTPDGEIQFWQKVIVAKHGMPTKQKDIRFLMQKKDDALDRMYEQQPNVNRIIAGIETELLSRGEPMTRDDEAVDTSETSTSTRSLQNLQEWRKNGNGKSFSEFMAERNTKDKSGQTKSKTPSYNYPMPPTHSSPLDLRLRSKSLVNPEDEEKSPDKLSEDQKSEYVKRSSIDIAEMILSRLAVRTIPTGYKGLIGTIDIDKHPDVIVSSTRIPENETASFLEFIGFENLAKFIIDSTSFHYLAALGGEAEQNMEDKKIRSISSSVKKLSGAGISEKLVVRHLYEHFKIEDDKMPEKYKEVTPAEELIEQKYELIKQSKDSQTP